MHRGIRGHNVSRCLILLPFLATGMGAQQTQPLTPAASAAVSAQGNDVTARLLKKIEEMEISQKRMQDEIDTLKGGRLMAPPAVPLPAVAQAPPAEPIQAEVETPADSHTLGPVEFRGFSDFDYGRAWFEKQPPTGLVGSPHSFNVGDFDLFTNTRISEHWSVLGEVLVTSDFSNEFSVEMDRLLFSYKPSEYFNFGFGKFNTALGYYPAAFNRARYFQTATSRPIMYGDEDNGGILPVHSIGLTSTGKIPSGVLGLHWIAELLNGRASAHPDVPVQNFVDEGNGKAVNFALYAKPLGWRGFQTGFSVYHDTLHPEGLPTIGENVYTAHAVYVGAKLEFLNEASIVRHTLKGTSEVYRSLTGYSQLSYAFGKLRPFVRYDYQNVPSSEPLFVNIGRMNGPSFGINRHVSNYVVLKLQYGRLNQLGHPTANDLQAQLAFAF